MAKSQQGRGEPGSLEAELTCAICLGLYQDPVSLSCGHSFCRRCIRRALGFGASYSTKYCPTCRASVGSALQSNFQLANIVKAFQTTIFQEQQDESSKEWNADAVPCEHCLDRPQPAVKTCLVCEASLCQAHLSKHNAKASQQEHILVEVGAGEAQERKCPEHGKLLEYYCQKDEKFICAVCYIAGGHKGHEVVTMKQERDKELAELSDPMMELQDSESDLVTALQELQESENHIKTNNRAVTSQLEELFKNMKTELIKKKKMILSDLQSHEEEQLAGIAKARQEMEQKRAQAQQNLQALQKIKEQPDVFLFFKELKLVKDRTADLDLDTESMDVQEVQLDERMITQCQTLSEKLMLQLDSLLQDVQRKLTKQKKLRRKASLRRSTIYSCFKNFDSHRPRCKKEVKNRHQN